MHVQFRPKTLHASSQHTLFYKEEHICKSRHIRWTRIKVRLYHRYFFTAGSVARTLIYIDSERYTTILIQSSWNFFIFLLLNCHTYLRPQGTWLLHMLARLSGSKCLFFYSTGDVDLPSLGLRTHSFFFSFFKTHWIGPLVPRQYQ